MERRAAYARRSGAPDVLQVDAERLPPPKPGEVLVRVEAVGLNHVETLIRADTYSIKIPFPYAVGFEGAGVAVAAGSDVDITPGARVCWTAVFGSCATLLVAPATMLARLPDNLSFADARAWHTAASQRQDSCAIGRWREVPPPLSGGPPDRSAYCSWPRWRSEA